MKAYIAQAREYHVPKLVQCDRAEKRGKIVGRGKQQAGNEQYSKKADFEMTACFHKKSFRDLQKLILCDILYIIYERLDIYMKKQLLYGSITYFVTMVAACLVNLLVCMMTVKIVNLFIVVDYFAAAVIRTVTSFIVTGGVVGAMAYYDAYKKADVNVGMTASCISLGGVAHLALSVPLMFYPFIAGGTRYLAGLIYMGSRFDSAERVGDIYLWTYLLAFGVYWIVQLISAVSCGYIGKSRRLAVRRSLTENNEQK